MATVLQENPTSCLPEQRNQNESGTVDINIVRARDTAAPRTSAPCPPDVRSDVWAAVQHIHEKRAGLCKKLAEYDSLPHHS